jgi:Uncharacterized conserved protein
VRPLTASSHLDNARCDVALNLSAGSWGKDGDWSMWLNPETAWTWEKLWPLEEEFWRLAPESIDKPDEHAVLAKRRASSFSLSLQTGSSSLRLEKRRITQRRAFDSTSQIARS